MSEEDRAAVLELDKLKTAHARLVQKDLLAELAAPDMNQTSSSVLSLQGDFKNQEELDACLRAVVTYKKHPESQLFEFCKQYQEAFSRMQHKKVFITACHLPMHLIMSCRSGCRYQI